MRSLDRPLLVAIFARAACLGALDGQAQYPSPCEEEQGGNMKDSWTRGLSRREFLGGASALGCVAITSAAARAQITTMAPFEKLPPYGNNTLPAGVKPRLVPNVNGLTVNMLEAGTQGRP